MPRGRKPGTVEKTGGRQKGTPNKVTADIRAAAGIHGPAALQKLVHLMEHAESEQTQVAACKEILDRAYGKSTQSFANDVDQPLFPESIKIRIVSPDGSSRPLM